MTRIGYITAGLLAASLVLASCSAQVSNDPKVFAQKLMHDAGKDSAKITNVVEGDKTYRKADALWCVATDLSLEDGQVPYLLAVWRTGDKWDGTQLEQGYYEWDLYGCSR
jgi:hypothetical protein